MTPAGLGRLGPELPSGIAIPEVFFCRASTKQTQPTIGFRIIVHPAVSRNSVHLTSLLTHSPADGDSGLTTWSHSARSSFGVDHQHKSWQQSVSDRPPLFKGPRAPLLKARLSQQQHPSLQPQLEYRTSMPGTISVKIGNSSEAKRKRLDCYRRPVSSVNRQSPFMPHCTVANDDQ